MKRIFSVFAVVLCGLALVSCGSQQKSNPGVDITGSWNVDLTDSGSATPTYSFGLKFSKNGATITGTEIPYAGTPAPLNGCINLGSISATGSTNGASVITLVVKDASTNSSFTISGTADSAVQQINGTYTATFGPNGSQPACTSSSGSTLMNRQ